MTLGVLPNLSELVSLSVNRDNCGIELWGSLCTRAAWRLACGGCLTAASVRPGTWPHCTSGRSGQERAASTPQPLPFLLALLPLPRAGTCPRGKAGSGWDGPTPAFPSRTCSEAQLRLGPSTRPDRPVSLSSAGATPAPDPRAPAPPLRARRLTCLQSRPPAPRAPEMTRASPSLLPDPQTPGSRSWGLAACSDGRVHPGFSVGTGLGPGMCAWTKGPWAP